MLLAHLVLRPLPTRSQRGASAVEYGLLISGVAAVMAVSVYLFGGSVMGLFVDSCATVKGSSC